MPNRAKPTRLRYELKIQSAEYEEGYFGYWTESINVSEVQKRWKPKLGFVVLIIIAI